VEEDIGGLVNTPSYLPGDEKATKAEEPKKPAETKA
jgi:hypothetical protein